MTVIVEANYQNYATLVGRELNIHEGVTIITYLPNDFMIPGTTINLPNTFKSICQFQECYLLLKCKIMCKNINQIKNILNFVYANYYSINSFEQGVQFIDCLYLNNKKLELFMLHDLFQTVVVNDKILDLYNNFEQLNNKIRDTLSNFN